MVAKYRGWQMSLTLIEEKKKMEKEIGMGTASTWRNIWRDRVYIRDDWLCSIKSMSTLSDHKDKFSPRASVLNVVLWHFQWWTHLWWNKFHLSHCWPSSSPASNLSQHYWFLQRAGSWYNMIEEWQFKPSHLCLEWKVWVNYLMIHLIVVVFYQSEHRKKLKEIVQD